MTDERKPGYLFNFSLALGDNQSLTVSGNFPVGVLKGEIDLELDKVYAAIERQRKKILIPLVEQKIMQAEDGLIQMNEDLALAQTEAEQAKERGKPTNGQPFQHVGNLLKNAKLAKRNIDEGKNELALMRALVGQIVIQ